MNYFIAIIIGYLVGSFPTAFLLIKKTKGLDIRDVGSGNVGAMNSYEISGSKLMGISVLLIDLIKGILSVVILKYFYPDSFILSGLSLFFAVFSHCFNPWLKFNGGRGLATAAGGALFLIPFLLFVWIILWVIFYLMKKDILFSNIVATIMSILVIIISASIAIKYSFPGPSGEESIILISVPILTLILIKHINPLKELVQQFFKKQND